MSGERFLLIDLNFLIVYFECHVTPKRTDRKQGVEGSVRGELDIVE